MKTTRAKSHLFNTVNTSLNQTYFSVRGSGGRIPLNELTALVYEVVFKAV